MATINTDKELLDVILTSIVKYKEKYNISTFRAFDDELLRLYRYTIGQYEHVLELDMDYSLEEYKTVIYSNILFGTPIPDPLFWCCKRYFELSEIEISYPKIL